MSDICNECVIEWIRGGEYAGITACSSSKFKGKIKKLAKKHPDEVKIISENSDGSIFAHAPIKYVHISRPREVSEERKKEASERFKKYHAEQARKQEEEDFIFE